MINSNIVNNSMFFLNKQITKNITMKKLIYSIVLLVSMTSLTYAQEAESIAKSNGKVELVQSKTTGVYQFSFATDRTAESVEKAASYYTSNFTVDFDEASKRKDQAKIKEIYTDLIWTLANSNEFIFIK